MKTKEVILEIERILNTKIFNILLFYEHMRAFIGPARARQRFLN
ncbi:hypothetical protein H312_01149 [Anncaliia algerae PRA339]|uniref:Uncharacterized protein n=1 Tax=Anncaliia algerae PRA339 TaxID=1288291 RepID=A0A059F305_9MICR|nr:hypothetical protein H312_01149 [Anncaliia algerae PRA339]